MFEIDFSEVDPAKAEYYYPVILAFAFGLLLIYMYSAKLKSQKKGNLDLSLSATLGASRIYEETFVYKKDSLKFRYLLSYCLTKSTVWSKAAYLYTLFSMYHNFSIQEIGLLYIVDAISALISGPLVGNLADVYGRRMFCQLYCVFVIVSLAMRVSTSRVLAYSAQILTGICSGLITTTFESWLNYESRKEFGKFEDERKRFLTKIFKTFKFK